MSIGEEVLCTIGYSDGVLAGNRAEAEAEAEAEADMAKCARALFGWLILSSFS